MRVLAMAVLMVALAAPFALCEEAGVMRSKHDCSLCHGFDRDKGRLVYRGEGTEMCMPCHRDRMPPAEHAVDVKPAMPVPKLPLWKGMLTCATCHEPHGLSNIPHSLRMEQKVLCRNCHQK